MVRKIKIEGTMEKICDSTNYKKKNYYPLLKEIHDYVSEYENQPHEDKAKSVKRIISRMTGGSE